MQELKQKEKTSDDDEEIKEEIRKDDPLLDEPPKFYN